MHDSNDTINVWIIEDIHEYRQELARKLNSEPGICCDHDFGSFAEALPAFRSGQLPQVLLVDIQLPGTNGIEIIKELKSRHPGLHMIVLTISESRETIFSAICAGASGYLLKNDPFAAIVTGIHLVIDGGSPLSGPVASMVLEAFKHTAAVKTENNLTEREIEILGMLSDGLVKKEIAAELFVAPTTIDYHLRSIYQKLHVNSQAGAVGKAMRKGLI